MAPPQKPSRKKKTIANENPKQDDPQDEPATNGQSVSDSPGELKVSTVPSESSKSLSSSMGSGDSAERTTAQDIDHLLKG